MAKKAKPKASPALSGEAIHEEAGIGLLYAQHPAVVPNPGVDAPGPGLPAFTGPAQVHSPPEESNGAANGVVPPGPYGGVLPAPSSPDRGEHVQSVLDPAEALRRSESNFNQKAEAHAAALAQLDQAKSVAKTTGEEMSDAWMAVAYLRSIRREHHESGQVILEV